MYDVVVRNGLVVDGSGGEPYKADVAVRDGRIAAVGSNLGPAKEEIDAQGLLVSPGFVDVHTHYDGQVTWESRLAPSANHGVTTIVTGHCRGGLAPGPPGEPWRPHHRHRQLRRRLRALPPGGSGRPHRPDGRRRGHSRGGHGRR